MSRTVDTLLVLNSSSDDDITFVVVVLDCAVADILVHLNFDY